MLVPAGAEPPAGFYGFAWSAAGASIMIIEMPTPYRDTVGGLTREGLAGGNMTFVDSEPIDVSGFEGILIDVQQRFNDVDYAKWLLVSGDGSHTLLITASYPDSNAAEFREPLRAALMSATWDPTLAIDQYAGLDWTIEPPEGLHLIESPGAFLMYTESGEVSPADRGAPLYVVAPSMGRTEITNIRATAEQEVLGLAQVTGIEIEQSRVFTLAELDRVAPNQFRGWEIVAHARDLDTGIELVVHQVMIMSASGYVRMVGLVGVPGRAVWVERFRVTARSWRRRAL